MSENFSAILSQGPCLMRRERDSLLRIEANRWPDRNKQAGSRSEERLEDGMEAEAARSARFSALVDRHARLMYSIAFSLLRNKQDAEDAVQETFLKLYRGRTWQQMEEEKAFLARSVWRVALDHLPRKDHVSRQVSLDESHIEVAGHEESPEHTVIRSAQQMQLRRLIDALPATLRQVLMLSAIDDLTSREVGLLLGIPEGTVRTRLMRARNELARRFQASEGGSLERV